jgi:hypothetical protein
LTAETVVWTEGKTDVQHLLRAREVLGLGLGVSFKQLDADMGDDQLLKQCKAMSMTHQECVTIFMFDRDNPEITSKVHDETIGYKRGAIMYFRSQYLSQNIAKATRQFAWSTTIGTLTSKRWTAKAAVFTYQLSFILAAVVTPQIRI